MSDVEQNLEVYLVGGAVRDRLLGLSIRERDWVVVGETPERMKALGFQQVGKAFPVFLHPETGEEYALARTERAVGQGHKDFVFSTEEVTLEEDLSRRDFTINAIAEDGSGELVDPHGGRVDLEARCLRHISPAFAEDPLRILRAARFYAYLPGFTVAESTLALMTNMVAEGALEHLSAERIWSEINRSLAYAEPWRFFDLLADIGAYERLFLGLLPWQDWCEVLASAVSLTDDVAARFACAALGCKREEVDLLVKRLSCPKPIAQMALLIARWGDWWLQEAPLSAQTYAQLLDGLDAWRRPERLSAFSAVCRAHGLDERSAADLMTAYRAASRVTAAQVASGLRGPAFGEAMRELRCLAIGRALDA